MQRWRLGIACVGLFAATSAAALPQLDLALDHWAYEFAERLTLRAGTSNAILDFRPVTRGEMAALVAALDAAARQELWAPTALEAEQLAMLRAEFSEELPAHGVDVPLLEQAYHVWSGDGWRLQAFYAGRERIDAGTSLETGGPDQADARVSLEPAAALLLGGRVLGVAQVDYRVRTSTAPLAQSTDPRSGEAEFVFEPGDRFSITRRVDPMLRYDAGGRWRIDLARTRVRWGPGRHDAMLLGGTWPPLDALQFRLRLGPARFASVAGQVRPARLRPDDPDLAERYLAAHRLEFAIGSWLQFALSEALVYGDRGLDLAYLNPLGVLFVTQANLGDRDNALGSADLTLRFGRGLRVYGECVVDDLNLRRGWAHYGNKLGLLAGFLWLAPFGSGDWDVDGEWSWASTYTYTHDIPVNRYEHYGASLGSRAGPDADRWTLGLRHRFSRGWWARAFYELERHGEGGLVSPDDERQDDTIAYLSGTVESRHTPGVEVRYRGLRGFDLGAAYRYGALTHPNHDAAAERAAGHLFRLETRVEF